MTRSARSWRTWMAAALLALAPVTPVRAAGEKIAFAVDAAPDGHASRVCVANADGTGFRPVSSGAGRDRAPALSPDGRQVVFQRTNDLGLDTLLVQPVEGTADGRALAVGSDPQWSPDGKEILFSRRQANDFSLYTIRADGSQKDAVLKPLVRGRLGRWSPDMKELALVAPVLVEGRERWQVQVMPAATLEPKFRLTLPETYGQVVSLDWSPDAGKLLFSVMREGRCDLYVTELKSPEPRRVPAGEGFPNAAYGSWSPDGREILFRATAAGDMGISRVCVMNADGTAVRVLWEPTGMAARVYQTAWQHPPKTPQVAAAPPVVKPDVKPEPKPQPPAPAAPPAPPAANPMPMPAPARVLSPPAKLYGTKLFSIAHARSPVSVKLGEPGDADFLASLQVAPNRKWMPQRQGIGLTLELADGSLYRGTVIHSGVPWVTLQGRPKGGKVRLIDGKKLPLTEGFANGFKLTVRREGANLILAVNDQDLLSRPVLTTPVETLALTLENFDEADARFPLAGIYFRKWETAPAPASEAKVGQ